MFIGLAQIPKKYNISTQKTFLKNWGMHLFTHRYPFFQNIFFLGMCISRASSVSFHGYHLLQLQILDLKVSVPLRKARPFYDIIVVKRI